MTQWEYVKGSEADFEGAPEWATIVIGGEHLRGKYWGEQKPVGNLQSFSDVFMDPLSAINTLGGVIAERRKVDNLQSRVNDANLGDALKEMFKPTAIVKVETRVPSKEESDTYNKRFDSVNIDELMAAKNTLEEKGYTWCGGSLWKPPLGKVPDYIRDSTQALIAERATRYGDFKDGAAVMQQLKAVMKFTPKWQYLKPSQKESLEMIQHKIGRILNGDPDYDDNWKDIAGYATLIAKELSK